MIHPLVQALNDNQRLPKYIIMFPDKDILTSLHKNNINAALVMGSTIHYLIKQIDSLLSRRTQQLEVRKPGALLPEETKIIWVRMLKRPSHGSDDTPWDDISPYQAALNLRSKFNSILEERLFDGNGEAHRIMSIEVNQREFDITGFLSSIGKEDFWKEIDAAMYKFDQGKITLNPRKPSTSKKPSHSKSADRRRDGTHNHKRDRLHSSQRH